jgi:hypothetical protein
MYARTKKSKLKIRQSDESRGRSRPANREIESKRGSKGEKVEKARKK